MVAKVYAGGAPVPCLPPMGRPHARQHRHPVQGPSRTNCPEDCHLGRYERFVLFEQSAAGGL